MSGRETSIAGLVCVDVSLSDIKCLGGRLVLLDLCVDISLSDIKCLGVKTSIAGLVRRCINWH